MTATVLRYNDDDGTYDLDVRQHAVLQKISPAVSQTPGAKAALDDAWPPGTMVSYLSASTKQWLPAIVHSYNVGNDTYNLDVRDQADVERIRARADAPFESATNRLSRQDRAQTEIYNGGCETSSSSRRTVYPRSNDVGKTSVDRSPAGDGARDAKHRHSGMNMEDTASMMPSPSASSFPSRYVAKGDRCELAGSGLAVIESAGRDGRFTVKADGRTRQAWSEDMRAPKELRYAWQPGTKVLYMSASAGKWIEASVTGFNPSSCTYNLDVRQEADPDKVKPR
mmetsp:Transcript_108704/g.212982  ORF Transcript_108704/g.212982 Transcript_108704/m.212982 type:complete len:282 (+) Transcript_108704:202-1047(+)